jgi:ABC-type lipoprotein export system ATPase subunit
VALARAMLLSPKIIIADEPTNDLDPVTGRVVINELLNYPDKQHAVIYATHDMAMARRADRILHLHNGKIEQISKDQLAHVFECEEKEEAEA